MRCLRKNKQTFHYALYLGNEEIKNSDGLYTGERKAKYGEPREMAANISAARNSSYGSVSTEEFGMDIQYDKVIVIDAPKCEIDEHTILCIDIPFDVKDGIMPYDYVVVKAARSLNSVSYAIQRVEVG